MGKADRVVDSNHIDWRFGNITDKRFNDSCEAVSRSDYLNSVKPRRHKARRESKSLRPCIETVERIHHSKGKQWDKFKNSKANIFQNLSEHSQLALMDSRKNGGTGYFADWKQQNYENTKRVKTEIFFDTTNGRMIAVNIDGKMVLKPYIEQSNNTNTPVNSGNQAVINGKGMFANIKFNKSRNI